MVRRNLCRSSHKCAPLDARLTRISRRRHVICMNIGFSESHVGANVATTGDQPSMKGNDSFGDAGRRSAGASSAADGLGNARSDGGGSFAVESCVRRRVRSDPSNFTWPR